MQWKIRTEQFDVVGCIENRWVALMGWIFDEIEADEAVFPSLQPHNT